MDDFDLTLTQAELQRDAPAILDTLRRFVVIGLCRQNNAAERKLLAERFAELSVDALKKFPHLKLNHANAKTIVS